MNGKINIVFGFLYLAATAALGPTLLVPSLGPNNQKFEVAAKQVEELRNGAEGASAEQAVVDIFEYMKGAKMTSTLAGAPHAHGNLEALLNIVAGFVLMSLVIPANFKALISVVLILGALLHSGMLYLGMVFGQAWAFNLTKLGAVTVLAGLVLMGIAAIVGMGKRTESTA